jgi:Ca2+:H+ antiporter
MSPAVSIRTALFSYVLPTFCFVMAVAFRVGPVPLEGTGSMALVVIDALSIVVVLATVFAALDHAEAIAHRVGEPYGTLVLTFAVTTIEVSIILSMMLHGDNNPTLARESVFSTVMIVCTGIVGICLTLGGWKHSRQDIKRQGTSAYLSILIGLTVLTMVLPNFTLTTGPGTFSPVQLGFVGLLSLLLYGSFVFAQSFGQKDDFTEEKPSTHVEHSRHAASGRLTKHLVFLLIGLVGIVLLTEQVAAGVEDALAYFKVVQPDAIVGAMLALIILLPEAISAIKAALRNELQRGLNVALGSACATIGMTIPVIAVASLITGQPLTLGLSPGDTVMLFLALAMSVVSFSTGRTTILTGLAHLVIFVAYALLIVVP